MLTCRVTSLSISGTKIFSGLRLLFFTYSISSFRDTTSPQSVQIGNRSRNRIILVSKNKDETNREARRGETWTSENSITRLGKLSGCNTLNYRVQCSSCSPAAVRTIHWVLPETKHRRCRLRPARKARGKYKSFGRSPASRLKPFRALWRNC